MEGNLPSRYLLIVSFKSLLLMFVTPHDMLCPTAESKCDLGDSSLGSNSGTDLLLSLLVFAKPDSEERLFIVDCVPEQINSHHTTHCFD